MNKNLLIIFTRNPELGKVKTRLAKDIGNENALEIFKILQNHTNETIYKLEINKQVFYSETINNHDIWNNNYYQKKLQKGDDLGQKMKNAFEQGFDEGFEKIVIIGSDLFTLQEADIIEAFEKLDENDTIIGPAEDGGYYLLGLKSIPKGIFDNKKWGTDSVFSDTVKDLKNEKVHLLRNQNDIDIIDDILEIDKFKKFINQL